MKMSTRGRYAIRAALVLAYEYGKDPVSLKHISKEENISVKYLENIMRKESQAGLVISAKGKGGGFVLARHPSKIKISDIIFAAEGSVDPVNCVTRPELCKKSKQCASRDIWSELRLRILQFLGSITLQDMMDRQDMKWERLGLSAKRRKKA